jgi:hypothetical protein
MGRTDGCTYVCMDVRDRLPPEDFMRHWPFGADAQKAEKKEGKEKKVKVYTKFQINLLCGDGRTIQQI